MPLFLRVGVMDLYHKEDGLLSSTPSYRFMNHGSAPGEADEPTILAAARRNDAKEVRRFVNAGGDVNATNQQGQTALHMAAANGKTDTVIMLLDMGATASLKSTVRFAPQTNAIMIRLGSVCRFAERQHGCSPGRKEWT